MKLLVKFNLVMCVVFLAGLMGAGFVSDHLLQRNAKEEIFENARIMMEAAFAVRTYTGKEIKPLLDTQIKYAFLPQSVPAYSANQYFAQIRNKFPEYSYREATLNPTNPVNRANEWEADIVQYFRQNPQETERVGERDTPTGRALYIARPMKVGQTCMQCHDTPDNAPRTLVDKYGPNNGFGWKVNDILTAQIVSAPMRLPVQRAQSTFVVFMSSLAVIFAIVFLAVNAMLIYLVTRPINRLSAVADELSLGNLNVPELQSEGSDEIAKLYASFNRMRKSLMEAIKMLETT
jgi:protein-histidine pros-kinase